MAHSAKNLSDKLIGFHGAGQDKVCAQKTAGTTKKPMQTTYRHHPQQILIYKILHQLTGLAPAEAFVRHDHGQLLASSCSRNSQPSSIHQVLLLLFVNFAELC